MRACSSCCRCCNNSEFVFKPSVHNFNLLTHQSDSIYAVAVSNTSSLNDAGVLRRANSADGDETHQQRVASELWTTHTASEIAAVGVSDDEKTVYVRESKRDKSGETLHAVALNGLPWERTEKGKHLGVLVECV